MKTAAPALALLLAACAAAIDGEPAWTPVAEETLTARQLDQRAAAVAARDALFGELMETLSNELSESEPPHAIRVCRDVAPRVAVEVGERHDVRIGRTSWALRNPANVGPAWTAALLRDRPEEPRFAAGPGGELGVTLPIRTARACLLCHGAADAIDDDVRSALAEHYPDDAATGFAEGDLRGWFWVEVPGAATRAR